MKKIYETIAKTEINLALAIIVAADKKLVGQKALLDEGGIILHNIADENIIPCVKRVSKEVLQSHTARLFECEGDDKLKIYFLYISHGNRSIKSIGARVVKYMDSDNPAWLILDITDNINWKTNIYYNGSKLTEGMKKQDLDLILKSHPTLAYIDGRSLYSEPVS